MTSSFPPALLPPPFRLLAKASLFLDLDGTLIDIAPRPDAVVVGDDLIMLLRRLLRHLEGRVAVVSGRRAADVLKLLPVPELTVVGSHGAELPRAGEMARPPSATTLHHVLPQLRKLELDYPGVLIEVKPFGLAIHYRQAPRAFEASEALAERIAATEGYHLQRGKQVIELKYDGITKGDAVRSLLAAEPMKSGRPIFMGDDLTDEAGFAAATESGGVGILIGPPRPTHATYGLSDVRSALQWIARAMEQAA